MIGVVRIASASVLFAAPFGLTQVNRARAQDLPSFGVVSGQSVTNTGPTTIIGNIAVSPGTSYTGSASVTQTGVIFLGDAVAGRVQNDLTTLYNVLAQRPTSNGGDLTGQDLGNQILVAGVYNFDTSASIAAGQTLTLDGGGNPNAVFIFNVGTTLTAQSGSGIVLQNGAQGGNVFFRIGSSATLDTTADLVGQIVALSSITLNTAATIDCGAVFAQNGSVTLDTNTIRICTLSAPDLEEAIGDIELTTNERAVQTALSDFETNGGTLPIGFSILAATQTPDELAESLRQLSGEVSTGLAPVSIATMDRFLDTVVRSRRPSATAVARPRDADAPIGLVREKIDAPYTGKYGSAPNVVSPPLAYAPAMRARTWDIWASGFGGHGNIDGDARTGTQDTTFDDRGFAAGINFLPVAGTDFGAAVSWGTADFSLGDGGGSGSSETLLVALRGRTSSDRAYVEGALAYGRGDVSTDRTVTIAGADRFTGDTTTDTIAARIEAGYRMGIFTPYAGLRALRSTTDAYAETTVSGSSSYALQYDKATTRSVRSELGVGIEWPARPAAVGGPTLALRMAWLHEFASDDAATRSFLSIPDADFEVAGTPRERDALLLSARVALVERSGLYVDATFTGEYSERYQDVSGALRVGYRW